MFIWAFPVAQEKGPVTSQETDPDMPMSVQESLVEVRVGGGLLQGGGVELSTAHGTFGRRSPLSS